MTPASDVQPIQSFFFIESQDTVCSRPTELVGGKLWANVAHCSLL